VRVWDIKRMRCIKTFSGHEAGVFYVACSPDSSVIASGSTDEVKIFNAQTSSVIQTILMDGSLELIRFLDQNTLMYATDNSIFVIHDLTGKTNTPTPKSKNLLKRCFQKFRTESLQSRRPHNEIDLAKDVKVLTFKYQGDNTAISSDGTRIASRTGENSVTIWQTDGPSPNHPTTGHYDSVRSVAVSGDGQLVASGSFDKTAKLWDPTTGRCLHTFRHPHYVDLVIFSPDSTLLASATSYHIRIWDTRSHNLISIMETKSSSLRLAFSPNGNRLVSFTGDLKLELWEVATGKCLASLDVGRPVNLKKVVFGVDGTSVILEDYGSLEVVRYEISPIHSSSSSNHDKDEHSSLPLEFIPLHDTRPSAISSDFHCYRQGNEWIIDEQDRRVFWVPPDLRYTSDSCGTKVVLGSQSGRVAMVDISDVRY
jgi:WD40 repeat protein